MSTGYAETSTGTTPFHICVVFARIWEKIYEDQRRRRSSCWLWFGLYNTISYVYTTANNCTVAVGTKLTEGGRMTHIEFARAAAYLSKKISGWAGDALG